MPIITNDIELAANQLKEGKVVAFATETVYGLGAIANRRDAVEKIYQYKNRPHHHPLIIHLSDFCHASNWACDIPDAAKKLAQAFMPGPITLLLPCTDSMSYLTGGQHNIAIRVPEHAIARQLLLMTNEGVVAPSANRFGHVSPTQASHVADEFPDIDDLLILNGGDCHIGIESTIVGFDANHAYIARPGEITADDIKSVLGNELIAPPSTLRASGMLPRHYAPQSPLSLRDSAWIAKIDNPHIGVISQQKPLKTPSKIWRRATTSPHDYAHHLYRYLRELDAIGVQELVVEIPPHGEKWHAIHNRLQRAAKNIDKSYQDS